MKPQFESDLPNKTSIGKAAAAALAVPALGGLFWAVRNASPAAAVLLFTAAAAAAVVIYYAYQRQKSRQLLYREEAAGYYDMLNHVNDAMLILDFQEPYRILEANRTACEWLGYKREELLMLAAGDITDMQSAEELFRHFLGKNGGEREFRETEYRAKDFRSIPVEANVRFIRLKGRRAMFVIAKDLSERKRMESKIRHMAYYDDLTGLPNRRLFRDQLNHAMKAVRPGGDGVAVYFIDIDRFKLVNDSYGHDYGDMLLMQLAERFNRCVGENDFLARTEGDEFTLYRTGVKDSDSQLVALAEKISQVLEQPFAVGEYQIHISVSIGISYYSGAVPEEADAVMKCADIALSRSKEKGKNNYQIFHTDMNSISLNRLTMENELRRALNRQEFVLVYQPQMNTDNGSMVGMEALIRWKHPERGIVSPIDFIPIAEETGLIVPMGEWVILEACKQNKEWQEAGFPAVPVSVNLSMRQFLQHNLSGRIRELLEQTGLQPEYLELEITESMTMDVEFATNSLLDLKELGVKISIDDFGTGYSSLYLLKKFPIDKLKIDRSFVRDIMTDPNDAAIVATIISMTKHLNLQVIAEGVETEEQLHFLHKNRCHQVQGYWFSPPVTAQQMAEMMKLNRGYGTENDPKEQHPTRKSVS